MIHGEERGRDPQLGVWLSTASPSALEMAASMGYSFVLLDVEHGAFDLTGIEHMLVIARGLGIEPMVKVLGPERSPIQQALDLGAAAVVIPHVLDVEHARSVTQFAKFPPAGDRSYAGGRTVGYAGPGEEWFSQQDADTDCYPMIEDWRALRDVDKILELGTVDGICMGMADLSLSRRRGLYRRSTQDWDDLTAAADAAAKASKKWIMPAWNDSEQRRARQLGASHLVVTMEFGALYEGLKRSLERAKSALSDLHGDPDQPERDKMIDGG